MKGHSDGRINLGTNGGTRTSLRTGSSELLHPLSGIIGTVSEGRPQQSLSSPSGTKNQGLEVLCAVLLTCRTAFGMGWSLASSAFHPSLEESSDREAGHQDLPSYKRQSSELFLHPTAHSQVCVGHLAAVLFCGDPTLPNSWEELSI